MMRWLWTKTLYDKRWFMFGWFLSFGFLAFIMVIFYPAMHQDGALDSLMNNIPPAFQGIMGSLEHLRTFPTYLASQLFDIRATLLTGVMVILLGLGLTVGEEDKGQLRTLVSLPISRTNIILQKVFTQFIIIAIALLGMVPGIWLGCLIIDEPMISGDILMRLLCMNWLLAVALTVLVSGAGFATGRRAAAMTLGMLAVVGGFILSTFAQSVDWLESYVFLSPLHYFPAVDIVKNGIAAGDVLVLSATTVISLGVGWVFFRRRDIRS